MWPYERRCGEKKYLKIRFFMVNFHGQTKKMKWNEIERAFCDHRKKQNDPFFFSCLVPTMIILLGKWRKYQWKINVYFSHGLFWPMVKEKSRKTIEIINNNNNKVILKHLTFLLLYNIENWQKIFRLKKWKSFSYIFYDKFHFLFIIFFSWFQLL